MDGNKDNKEPSYLDVPQDYFNTSPGTEDTTITQAVPPVPGLSIILHGLIPAITPNMGVPGLF